jgi:hypothetical protein
MNDQKPDDEAIRTDEGGQKGKELSFNKAEKSDSRLAGICKPC